MNVIPLSLPPSLLPFFFLSLSLSLERGKETIPEDSLSTWRLLRARAPVFYSSSPLVLFLSLSNSTSQPHHSQSPAATRLLLVGLPGGRYYPCGSFAMSFFRGLIDGAKNSDVVVKDVPRVSTLSPRDRVISLSAPDIIRHCFFVTRRRRIDPLAYIFDATRISICRPSEYLSTFLFLFFCFDITLQSSPKYVSTY